MNLYMTGVDHEPLEVGIIHQFFQQFLPVPLVAPTAETAVGVLPISEIRRQIPPGSAGAENPDDGIDKLAVVGRHASPASSAPWQQGFENGPDAVGNVMTVKILAQAGLFHES